MLLVIGAAFLSSYATTISVTNVSNNGIGGNYFVDNNVFTFSSASPQYQVAPSSQSQTSQPVTWSGGGTIYMNAVTAGDWVYVFTVTVATASAGTYTVTVQITENGSPASGSPFSRSITITGASSGSMTMEVDLGTSINANVATVVSA